MASRWKPFVLTLTSFAAVAALAGGSLTVDAARAPAVGATTGRVTVIGSGFGHGVGMSQYGAYGMARAGSDVTEIVEHYFTGAKVQPVRDDVDIRVNVVHGARRITLSVRALTEPGADQLADLAWRLSPAVGAPIELSAGDTVTLAPGPLGKVRVTPLRDGVVGPAQLTGALRVQWPGTRALAGPASIMDVAATGAGGARKARAYRWGELAVSGVGGYLDAVAVLDLHGEYLRGVAEMPSSWPAAALQAQAVVARNYALVAARRPARATCGGCHLWDDTRSQVYAGWAKEAERIGSVRYGDRWVAAVQATQISPTTSLGVVFRGRLAETFFASSTGGRSRNAVDVWGTDLPYLRSVPDPWSVNPKINPGYARWTRTASVWQLRDLLGLADLARVEVTKRDDGGAALQVTGTASDGTQSTVSGATLARRLGLPGAWIASVNLPGTAPPAVG